MKNDGSFLRIDMIINDVSIRAAAFIKNSIEEIIVM